MDTNKGQGQAHLAVASAKNLSISTKQSVEISKCLRYKTTTYAKRFLEEVIKGRKAVPFRSFNQDTGHKPGMAAGRYPQKAAGEFLKLLRSVEANAQVKGLDVGHLKITKLMANKASIPLTGGRVRHGAKRSHLEVEVKELMKKGKKEQQPASLVKGAVTKEAVKEVHSPAVHSPAVRSPAKDINKETSAKTSGQASPISPLVSHHRVDSYHPEDSHHHEAPKEMHKLKAQGEQKPREHQIAKEAVEVKGGVKDAVEKNMPMRERISEPSSADLLKQVQAKAAVLNRNVKDRVDVGKVEDLYGELQKKGTLRGKS